MRKRNIKVRRLLNDKTCDNYLRRIFSTDEKSCKYCHYYMKIDNQIFCSLSDKKRNIKLV